MRVQHDTVCVDVGTMTAYARDATPLPSDIQPVANETRDRIITGLVTLVPFLALGLAGWQVWGEALHWSDVFLFLGMYSSPGWGSRSASTATSPTAPSKPSRWLHGLLAILGSAAIEGPVISWVADHRKHHAFSDEQGDPHSPHVDHGHGLERRDARPLSRPHGLALHPHPARQQGALRPRPARATRSSAGSTAPSCSGRSAACCCPSRSAG